MRQFASSGFRLWNLSPEAKLVYTAFGLFSLLALVASALLYEEMVGTGTRGVRKYYLGEPHAASEPAKLAPQEPGPQMALPEEEFSGPAITVAMPYRKLLEVTHFHLFTVPVFLLIVAHLFMLTDLSSRAKMVWIAGGWGAALAHLGAPWAVRYGGVAWAPMYVGSGLALAITSAVLTLFPIWVMWRGAPEARRKRRDK
ncbi:MAG TPA: hypothetical protein VH877_21860 [Polyangia bacterium]|jgi:hypothetical protein|nr:hypothetical protein [Polyangia bacterium]